MKCASQNAEMTSSDSTGQLYLLKRLVLAYVHTHKKKNKINFIYLGNKEIYYIFKTSCMISVLFSTKCHSFPYYYYYYYYYYSPPCSNNIFLIDHVLKFKNQPDQMQVK